jgi:nicotinamidase-related amidase
VSDACLIVVDVQNDFGHASFASSHPGGKPFETIDLPYGKQVLWPDHCVQGTPGLPAI